MADIRNDHALPGLAWAVTPVVGPLVAGANGVRRLDEPDALTVRDRLHLGSCTKPMTATLIASLIPEALQWNTRIIDVIPPSDVHPAYRDATLTHLLAHTSGLPPFDEDEHFLDAPPFHGAPIEQREAFARYALTENPTQAIGEYGYSNAGFGVAAVMAEIATGQAWEDLLRTRVFEPLQLDSAGFGWPGRVAGHEPWGHISRSGKLTPHDPHDAYQLHAGIGPAGDVHMSILEFAAFARDHLRGLRGRGALLTPTAYERLHTPVRPGSKSGLGWGVSTYRGKRASSHSGSADTFMALLLLLPDEDHAFVVVTNAAGNEAEAGTKLALQHLVAQFTSARVATGAGGD